MVMWNQEHVASVAFSRTVLSCGSYYMLTIIILHIAASLIIMLSILGPIARTSKHVQRNVRTVTSVFLFRSRTTNLSVWRLFVYASDLVVCMYDRSDSYVLGR